MTYLSSKYKNLDEILDFIWHSYDNLQGEMYPDLIEDEIIMYLQSEYKLSEQEAEEIMEEYHKNV